MANQHINKVIYGNRTLIDLTGDTVEAARSSRDTPPTTSPALPSRVHALLMSTRQTAPPPWRRSWSARPHTPAAQS